VITYLFLGYTAVWTLLFIYFLYISGRQRALERDVMWIRDHLARRESALPAPQDGAAPRQD